jgi:hypothetical protein
MNLKSKQIVTIIREHIRCKPDHQCKL